METSKPRIQKLSQIYVLKSGPYWHRLREHGGSYPEPEFVREVTDQENSDGGPRRGLGGFIPSGRAGELR